MSNTRNYRVPTEDDDANVPYWNDLLATDVAADVDVLEGTVVEVQSKLPADAPKGPYARLWVDENDRVALGIRESGAVHVPHLEADALELENLEAGTVTADVATIAGGGHTAAPTSRLNGYAKVWLDVLERLAFGIRESGAVHVPHLEADVLELENLEAGTVTADVATIAGGGHTAAPTTRLNGYAKVWLDENERLALGIRESGTVHIPHLETPALEIAEEPPLLIPAYRDGTGALVRRESRSDVIMTDGDSITQGVGDEAGLGGYPGRLATLLGSGITVYNQGLSSRSSTELVIRQGGIVPLVTVEGNTIPASGSVNVSKMTPTTSYRFAHSSAGIWEWDGELAGIPGKLRHDIQSVDQGSGWTFLRTTAGTAVPVPKESPFVMKLADAYRDATLILWYGRNNVGTGKSVLDSVRDTRAAVRHLTPESPRYLVLSILTAKPERTGGTSHGEILAANKLAADTFGDRYLDVRRHLIVNGLADAGITPTADDLNDIAGDTVPQSLRADDTHPNAAGYGVIARYLKAQLTLKGWI